MSIEVELKFRSVDSQAVREGIQRLGGRCQGTIEQVDTYFAHPVRDFAQTDEALRVRRVGDAACMTYKGPLLDRDTKSREETEIDFLGGAVDADRFSSVLEKLGFRPVRDVRKSRERWSLRWQDHEFEVAFDDVVDLGTFVELETASDRHDFETVKGVLLALADELGLKSPERRSYLALLIADAH